MIVVILVRRKEGGTFVNLLIVKPGAINIVNVAHDGQRQAWLRSLGALPGVRSHDAEVETVLDALAAHLEAHMDVDRLLSLAR